MTERKYEIGRWYAHDGGSCPVPNGSCVDLVWRVGGLDQNHRAGRTLHDWLKVVAFCVTEYPEEEETRTGTCWVENYKTLAPAFWDKEGTSSEAVLGTYTVTTINGKPKRIVWDADQ
jgi:hypothetical protein